MPSPVLGGIKYVYSVDPMKELTNSTGVLIRQEAQFTEQFIRCESPNSHQIVFMYFHNLLKVK